MGETAHSTRSSAEGTAGGTCDSLPEQRVKRNRARRHCTEHRHRIRHHPQHATARHRPTDKSARQQDISGPKKLTQQAGLVEVDIGGDVTSKRRHGERGTRWSRTQQREPEGGEKRAVPAVARKKKTSCSHGQLITRRRYHGMVTAWMQLHGARWNAMLSFFCARIK